MTNNLNQCYYCGTTENVELHHCIHGSKENRALATRYHLVIGICSSCHRGVDGIHGKYGEEKDLKLQAEAQQAWEERRVKRGKSTPEKVRSEWLAIFGVDYIKQFAQYIEECKQDFLPAEDEEEVLEEIYKEKKRMEKNIKT